MKKVYTHTYFTQLKENWASQGSFQLVDSLIDLQHVSTITAMSTQIKVHTDEQTQVHSPQSSLTVNHPRTNHAWRHLTSISYQV